MSESKAKILTEIAKRTGLNRETIKDLMKNGWVYQEDINQKGIFTQGQRYLPVSEKG